MSNYYSFTKNGTACSQLKEKTIWRDYLALTKPRIYISISITALMGLALQSNFTHYSVWIILSLAVATVLASAGGAVLNHYFERETDALMERTKDRPLVKGTIHPPRYALYFGWSLALSGGTLCYFSLGGWATFWLLMGFFTYVFVYTLWLKHNSYWNVTIGGFCSSFAVLAGDTAISGTISTNGFLLAILLFFWNPVHFLNLAVIYQADYTKAGIPMLPQLIGSKNTQGFILINLLLVVGCSLGLGVVGTPGAVYLSIASVAGFLLIAANIQNYILITPKLFRRNFIFANMYLLILFIGISIDFFF